MKEKEKIQKELEDLTEQQQKAVVQLAKLRKNQEQGASA